MTGWVLGISLEWEKWRKNMKFTILTGCVRTLRDGCWFWTVFACEFIRTVAFVGFSTGYFYTSSTVFTRISVTIYRCKTRCNLIINAIDVFFFFVVVSDRHLSWPHPLFWEGKIVGVINSLHPIISMHFLYTIDKRELIEWSRTFQVVDQLLYSHALRVWIRGDLWGEISCQGYNVER